MANSQNRLLIPQRKRRHYQPQSPYLEQAIYTDESDIQNKTGVFAVTMFTR